jgi:HAD superfamily hydrolase (TIGR01549 family)
MVVFDVGETLVDETRHWSDWADDIRVPRFTFLAALGGVIARGQHHRDVFRLLIPDFDYEAAHRARLARGWRYSFEPQDFYPDAIACLRELKARGFRVGIVGNQHRECEAEFNKLGLVLDLIGSSERWGVEKPLSGFFARIAQESGLQPAQIAYVGDHPVNDVAGAARAGMVPIFLRRGPWATLHADSPEAAQAKIRLENLAELPDRLAVL